MSSSSDTIPAPENRVTACAVVVIHEKATFNEAG